MGGLVQHAAQIIATGDEIAPMFVAVDRAGQSIVALTPWDGEEAKAAILDALRAKFREIGVVRYGVVSEAWMLSVAPGDPVIAPSKSDRRVEVVIVSAVESGSDPISVTLPIIRDPGVPPRLGEPMRSATVGGRMTALLD